ncbi:MAG: GNAT family N-acetyltransferase [Gammaproteobacteria bacterium]|nr:GNAT family N-acetyltransferase [Gammaproteobacteria bacterium]
MSDAYRIRSATSDDARDIASLIAISSDGVAQIEWYEEAGRQHCDPLDIGERTYKNPHGDYSFNNAAIVEISGEVAGMLLAFEMPAAEPRNPANRPAASDDNVFAPYIYLEEPDSWYVCGVALYPQYRGQGLGTRLMHLANEQARDNGYSVLSLVAFEQNKGAVNLYEKLGYTVVDHAPIVPHPLIHCEGNALLMVRPVEQ